MAERALHDTHDGEGGMRADTTPLEPISVPRDVTAQSGCRQSLAMTAKIAAVICTVELLTLAVFAVLPTRAEGLTEALIHTVLLVAVAAPFFLLWGIRPYVVARNAADATLVHANEMLRREIGERILVEEKLRAHEHELEMRVEEIDFVKHLMEKQAADAVGLAEDLALQKREVEESERRNEYLANHDTLTGLPNRRSFEQRLMQMKELARTRNGSVTLIFVDLDNFKAVNDALGHQRGDELLEQVARKLRGSTRDSDLIARLGGDEFAIVSTQFGHGKDDELRNVAERIRMALSIPVDAGNRVIPVSATLGIATYPADAADEQKLLQCADRAMYAAKERGRNRVVFYHELEALPAAS